MAGERETYKHAMPERYTNRMIQKKCPLPWRFLQIKYTRRKTETGLHTLPRFNLAGGVRVTRRRHLDAMTSP